MMAETDGVVHLALAVGWMPNEMPTLRAPSRQAVKQGLQQVNWRLKKVVRVYFSYTKRTSSWNSQLVQINHSATESVYPKASRITAMMLNVPVVAAVFVVVEKAAGNTRKLPTVIKAAVSRSQRSALPEQYEGRRDCA